LSTQILQISNALQPVTIIISLTTFFIDANRITTTTTKIPSTTTVIVPTAAVAEAIIGELNGSFQLLGLPRLQAGNSALTALDACVPTCVGRDFQLILK
jgi:hypothetical protein